MSINDIAFLNYADGKRLNFASCPLQFILNNEITFAQLNKRNYLSMSNKGLICLPKTFLVKSHYIQYRCCSMMIILKTHKANTLSKSFCWMIIERKLFNGQNVFFNSQNTCTAKQTQKLQNINGSLKVQEYFSSAFHHESTTFCCALHHPCSIR